MSLAASTEYQDYRAPRADGTALVQPSAESLVENLGSPSFVGSPHGIEFCGKSLDYVREQARREVVEKAVQFTSRYRDLPARLQNYDRTRSLILSGHQPELFHAGVWFKNFLLASLASETDAIGINFLVDNDLCRSTAIRVPTRELDATQEQAPTTGSSSRVRIGPDAGFIAKSILFDSPRDAVPWELRRLGSEETWKNFPAAVQQCLLPGIHQPILSDLWPDACDAVRRTNRPGLALAQARHKLERRIGLKTLEVPLSDLVSTLAFARFSIQLLSELPRFHEIYNSQLNRFRIAHRIRSHAHPVPALEQQHGWLEAPWWVYRDEAPQRQPLWVRVQDEQLMLSDRSGWQAVIEGRLDCDNASSQWLDLLADGICLRPRALLTTMYLRIMVSDLFIHGIGGGKYDQLTNGIVREFFGIDAAPMAVATATLHLPIALNAQHESQVESANGESESAAERDRMWQLKYHAERMVAATSEEFETLRTQKSLLLAHIPARGEKWRWHREMTAVNRRLKELAAAEIDASKQRLDELAVQERQQRVLRSREYSFCLYPLEMIASRLKELAG